MENDFAVQERVRQILLHDVTKVSDCLLNAKIAQRITDRLHHDGEPRGEIRQPVPKQTCCWMHTHACALM